MFLVQPIKHLHFFWILSQQNHRMLQQFAILLVQQGFPKVLFLALI